MAHAAFPAHEGEEGQAAGLADMSIGDMDLPGRVLETGRLATPTVKKGKARASGAGANKSSRSRKKSAKGKAVRPSFFKRLRRWIFKWAMIIIVIALLLPVAATLFYWPSAVHPVSTLMISKRLKGEKVTRTWVPIEEISPFVWQSVISSEDGKFCAHNGVDWGAVNEVVDDFMEGESPRGASTIPMQTVKNLYLWPNRSYVRKFMEVPLALLVDAVWSKRRMMEIYLNIAEWGPGIFGIEAAAQHHFGRSARKLNRKQAALLAVSLPNPKARNPGKPGKGLKRLARTVEKRARASGAYVKCLKPETAPKTKK